MCTPRDLVTTLHTHPSIRSVVTKKGIEKRHPSIHSIGCYKKRNRKKNSPSTFVYCCYRYPTFYTKKGIEKRIHLLDLCLLLLLLLLPNFLYNLQWDMRCRSLSLINAPLIRSSQFFVEAKKTPYRLTVFLFFVRCARVALPPPHNPSFAQPHRRSTLRPPQYSSSARLLNELQR